MAAVMKFASVPASTAFNPRRARSDRRLGASDPMPPIWMPMELKLANPHSAYVAMMKDRGSSVSLIGPSFWKATNSLITRRVPSRVPIAGASFQLTPKSHATGAKSHPKICSRLKCTRPKMPLTSAIRAINAIRIAAMFNARCRPSMAPRPAASITLTGRSGSGSICTSPAVVAGGARLAGFGDEHFGHQNRGRRGHDHCGEQVQHVHVADEHVRAHHRAGDVRHRSEERRVGKECRSRW